MTVGDGAFPVPEGWYPDPANSARFRRWDGRNWTADVTETQPAAPVSVPSAPVFAEPPRPEEPAAAPEPPRAAPAAPPTPPPPPAAPTTVAEPQSGPVSIPDWANLPGLTLPPDLSSIPGLGNDAVLPMPKFDDSERVAPPVVLPLPTPPLSTAPPEPYRPHAPEHAAPGQAAAPTSRRALRGLRSDDEQPSVPQPSEPSAPYAPPPSGAQYNAPAPPGIVYTPPPPGTALPASALGMPPMSALPDEPNRYESSMVTSRYDEPAVGARFNTRSAAPSSASQYVPMARSSGVSMGVTEATATSTAGVWLIALLPLIQFAVVYVVFGVLAEPVVPGIQWGILVAPAVLSLIFASIDRRKLVDDGYGQLPSAVLALIPPLYLLVRCFTIGWKSVFALVLWVVLQAAAVVGVYLLLAPVLTKVLAGG